MNLLPRELDKVLLHNVGELAQKRLARGVRLNYVEATALIATVLQELIRDGQHSVAELMSVGKKILGRAHVQPGVAELVHEIQVEGAFRDGVFLVTVHDPICSDFGDVSVALYGSFCPLPPDGAFTAPTEAAEKPGALILASPKIELNPGRKKVSISVTNTGDRPVQVGSHYHFAETNKALKFDRGVALFMRLDIAAGTAVRFEPGDCKTVQLVEIGGAKRVIGGNALISGAKGEVDVGEVLRKIQSLGFLHASVDASSLLSTTPTLLSRAAYASMYGPTVGDKLRLGDTSLYIEVEKDLTLPGEELKFGGGKVIREGMGQKTGAPDPETLDLVITNALILDWSGIYKADIGIKNHLIVGIGKAGNPDVMDGVTPGLIVGVNTDAIAGEGMIITAGGIDTHVHFICPQLCEEALASGLTTLIGGGTGPSAGTNATTCTPGQNYIETMLRATDGVPLNIGLTGKGNDSAPAGLVDQVRAGVCGLKLHEDWGTTPAAIDACLQVADEHDVQVTIHTDTLNESGFVEDTIAAFKGRTIHTYHSEGAGGGHAPDIIVVAGQENVLPSSTNPTRPYCVNTLDEHLDMLMVCHHLDKSIPEDIAFAESRIRAETVAAEDVLHDIGAISMISSDAQAMGRIGEVVARTWRTASKMRSVRGPLAGASGAPGDSTNDNLRAKRYIAKYTINPAISHGISHLVGDVAVGKLADLVLWTPAEFGVRPTSIIKGGVIAWANMGDANASIPTVQPVYGRPMWASKPEAAPYVSYAFVSKLSLDSGVAPGYGLKKTLKAVSHCRDVTKKDMKLNDATPKITVDPETYKVTADGEPCVVGPATELPLSQGYMLF